MTQSKSLTSFWRVVAASVIGTNHWRVQMPCQDAFDYVTLPSGEMVVALADGAGSAAHAGKGALLAVQIALRSIIDQLGPRSPETSPSDEPIDEFQREKELAPPFIRVQSISEGATSRHDEFMQSYPPRYLSTSSPKQQALPNACDWQQIVTNAFVCARKALIDYAEEQDCSVNEFATTLLLVVLDTQWLVCGLIGDCAVVLLDENDDLYCPCSPQKGEYANMTTFLTHPDALQWLDIQIFDRPIQSAALFSDGLLELAMNIAQNRPFAPFFGPLFAFVSTREDPERASQELAAFLDSPRINTRIHDDKTLVLLSRVKLTQHPPASLSI